MPDRRNRATAALAADKDPAPAPVAMTLAEAPRFAMKAAGLDKLHLLVIGCRLPPNHVARHLDSAAWATLDRLARCAAANEIKPHSGGWGDVVDAAAGEVERCAPGEWPMFRPLGLRSAIAFAELDMPVSWGSRAVADSLARAALMPFDGVLDRTHLMRHRAAEAWADYAGALEVRAMTSPRAGLKRPTLRQVQQLGAKAQTALALVGPLVVITTPASDRELRVA